MSEITDDFLAISPNIPVSLKKDNILYLPATLEWLDMAVVM